MEQCALTLTNSARCKLGRNLKMSRKCSSLWDWQISMINTFVILLILLHCSLSWCLLCSNEFGVLTRMRRLISYGSSNVTHLCYVCLTYHVALLWIQMHVSMPLELYYCRNIVMGCILWLYTLQSTTWPNVTMGLGTRNCLLSYRHVPNGIVIWRACHKQFTLTMSLTKLSILSHFFHVVRLAGWSRWTSCPCRLCTNLGLWTS